MDRIKGLDHFVALATRKRWELYKLPLKVKLSVVAHLFHQHIPVIGLKATPVKVIKDQETIGFSVIAKNLALSRVAILVQLLQAFISPLNPVRNGKILSIGHVARPIVLKHVKSHASVPFCHVVKDLASPAQSGQVGGWQVRQDEKTEQLLAQKEQ